MLVTFFFYKNSKLRIKIKKIMIVKNNLQFCEFRIIATKYKNIKHFFLTVENNIKNLKINENLAWV